MLAVNVLALILLAVGFLYLGRYEQRLVAAELYALRDQARVFAVAIGEGALVPGADEGWVIDVEPARAIVRRLTNETRLRTRLFRPDGDLVADSRTLAGPGGAVQIVALPPHEGTSLPTRVARAIYDWIVVRAPDWSGLPQYEEGPQQTAHQSPDALLALVGEASARAWRDSEGELVLTAAVPVQRLREVLGVVLVSRSGADIADTMRAVRLELLQVFGVTLLITILLSVWLAQTIARPIRRLAQAADRVRPGTGTGPSRRQDIPDFGHLNDEIGDLSEALRDMTSALWGRMDAIERFAADVAHEIKNPLASLRSAVETVGRIEDPERRARLMAVIEHDVRRLDRLITDISAASRVDAELSRADPEPIDIDRLLSALASMHADTDGSAGAGKDKTVRVVYGSAAATPPPASTLVLGVEDRLVQVFRNLIANAISFSPSEGTVRLALGPAGPGRLAATVSDDGPGIPPGRFEAIFDRFYTERPRGEAFGQHSGLGLSISRQIVEAHGGTLTAANRTDTQGRVLGAIFTVALPVYGAGDA